MKPSLTSAMTWAFSMFGLFKISDAACPQDCRCVKKEVNCYGAGLSGIPPNLSPDTLKLDLQSNEIEILDSTSFQALPNLKEIKLRYNKLQNIENGTFDSVPSLERIDMGTNLLTSLPVGLFSALKNLTLMDVSENYLTDIDGVFINLPLLQRLDLAGNQIQQLSNNSFTGLKKLIYLILSKNKISRVDKKSLASLKKLSFLLLSNNPIKDLDDVLIRNKRISFLDLSKCQLTAIPQGLPLTIRYFQLSQNNIKNISTKDLAPYTRMGILVLDKNNISYIEPDAVMKMKFLREFWLNANQIDRIPNIPAAVESLHMEMNKISVIKKNDFPPESNLKILSIKGNLIESIETDGLKNLEKLTNLYLSDNRLKSLDTDVFENLVNLKRLELNKNKIKKIEKSALNGMISLKRLEMAFIEEKTDIQDLNLFKHAPVLKILDLQGSVSIANAIFTSNTMVKSLSKLEDLNLMDCQLSTVSPILYGYDNLKQLKLVGNQWHCDVRLKWLRDWIKFDDGILMYSDHLICYTPSHLKDRSIGSLRDADFIPVTTTSSTEMTTQEDKTVGTTVRIFTDQRTYTNSNSTSESTSNQSIEQDTTLHNEENSLTTRHIQSTTIRESILSTTNKKDENRPFSSKKITEHNTITNKNIEPYVPLSTTSFLDTDTTSVPRSTFKSSSTVLRNSEKTVSPSDRTLVDLSTSVLSKGENTTMHRSKMTGSTPNISQENTNNHVISEKPTPAVNEFTHVRRASSVSGRKHSSYTKTTTPIYNVMPSSSTLLSTRQEQNQKDSTSTNKPPVTPQNSTMMLVDEDWWKRHMLNTTTAEPKYHSTPKHINISFVDGIPVQDDVEPGLGQSSSRNLQMETENVKIIVLVTALAVVALVVLLIIAAFLKKNCNRKKRYHTARVICDKNHRKISIIDIEEDDPDKDPVSTSDKASMTSHSLDVTQPISDEPEQCLLES